MKNLLFILPVLFLLGIGAYSPANNESVCIPCSAQYDALNYNQLPSFKQDDWYESTDPWYGLHYTSLIHFSDGYSGKIFKGGSSGKYFIGGSTGGKFYYEDQRTTIRALYLFKKYDCISSRYTK